MLREVESVELQYLFYLGFKYIGRHEIGTVEVFKELPVRNKLDNGVEIGGYDTWVIGEYPVKDFSLRRKVELGEYNFIRWEDGIIEIKNLIGF